MDRFPLDIQYCIISYLDIDTLSLLQNENVDDFVKQLDMGNYIYYHYRKKKSSDPYNDIKLIEQTYKKIRLDHQEYIGKCVATIIGPNVIRLKRRSTFLFEINEKIKMVGVAIPAFQTDRKVYDDIKVGITMEKILSSHIRKEDNIYLISHITTHYYRMTTDRLIDTIFDLNSETNSVKLLLFLLSCYITSYDKPINNLMDEIQSFKQKLITIY